MSAMNDLSQLEECIGYKFKNKMLLKRALTHSSYANEQKINKYGDYERLEFLGDAVLELVTSDFLYREHPDDAEGQLTRLRASMVCEPALAFCAKDLNLGSYILFGKGEESTGGRNRDSIIADVMEAIIGAIFLDGGFEAAKKHIEKFVLSDLEHKQLFYDAKSILQERIQQAKLGELQYKMISESGPEHDKEFVAGVFINGREIGKGTGRSKKQAEQRAAYETLLLMTTKRA